MTLPLAAIDDFARLWTDARRVVVFTGAGMSTESGLPDFRSNNGLWKNNRRFEELASTHALHAFPEEFDEFYRTRIRSLDAVKPNAGHDVLARLQAKARLSALITQNVDGLHEAAGSQGVLCLHGTLRSAHCEICNSQINTTDYLARSRCEHCSGKLRPSVVLFGEGLSGSVLQAAHEASSKSDLFVVLGSSLLVSPANTLPLVALQAGAKLVIVNAERTPHTSRAHLHLFESVGSVLTALEERL